MDLEQTKKDLLKKLCEIATRKVCLFRKHKLEVLHKRINAIVRYQKSLA